VSFIVQIWEQPEGLPKPNNVQEACALFDRVAEGVDAVRPNARLKAFLLQIRERWPVIEETDWEGKRKVDLGVWKDDSLLRDLDDEPVLVLAISTTHVGDVVPWLAEAGPLAGVSVVDPQSGSAWLADGSVHALGDEGACAKAEARYRAADDRAAWEGFIALAQRGHRHAFHRLSEMYAKGRFVGRDPVISMALSAMANGWRLVDGVALPPEGVRTGTSSSLVVSREDAGAAACAKVDALFARLRSDGNLRETLLAEAHEFDARHVAALDLVARGEFAAAAMRLQPLADRGHAPSQRALGHLWSTGRATPHDPAKELAWITAAAEVGDDLALQRVAWLYDEGVLCKRATHDARGVHRLLISRGATSAIRDASRVELKRLNGPAGNPFWEGRSESELLPLAEQGDAAAMVELARVIEWGRSLDKVWERSTPWWIRAAEAGHPLAQRRLGSFHEQGRGVPKDEVRATHWYGLSARQGDGFAQVEYARRLGLGQGIARDDAQARHWLQSAARQRIPSALGYMAKGYATGGLFPKDLLAAQVLVVVHDRIQDWGHDGFHGPDEADPYEVRRLLAEIDGGADLIELLKRRAPAQAPERAPASSTPKVAAADGGLSLAPMAASRPPAPAPARERTPAPAREAARPIARPANATQRRAAVPEDEAEFDAPVVDAPVERSPVGPLLILASFGVLLIAVAMLRRDAYSNVVLPWLVGSVLAAAGEYRISRENGHPPVVAWMDAAPMFIPFVGSGLAARTLHLRWRGIPA